MPFGSCGSDEPERMPAILRTHGGLGNQLFQVLYGRLFAEKHAQELCEVHDTRYAHAFPRSAALHRPARAPAPHERWLSALRLPKVLQRLAGRPEGPLWLLGSAYLDGYFQAAQAYAPFEPAAIRRHLQALRSELSIRPAHIDQCLVHLRVGDFFASRQGAREHIEQRLKNVPPNSSIMTNDEALLAQPAVAELLAAKGCRLVSTAGFAAEDVLRSMAAYGRLDANDSTLVFWASVLGGSKAALQHAGLHATQALFSSSLLPAP